MALLRLFQSILFLLLITWSPLSGALSLSPAQQRALNEARHIGAAFSPTVQEWLGPVLLVESSLCRYGHSALDKDGWGCGQVHPASAEALTNHRYTPHELLHNQTTNITLAARILDSCVRLHPGDIDRALICYNAGPGKEAKHPAKWRYVRRVRKARLALETHPRLPEGLPASPTLTPASTEPPPDTDLIEQLSKFPEIPEVLEFQDCTPCQLVPPAESGLIEGTMKAYQDNPRRP